MIKYHISGNKEQKPLKNKALEEIHKTDFDFTYSKKKSGKTFLIVEMNTVLQPASRPRSSNGIVYDPLKSYKSVIIKNITKFLEDNNLQEKFPVEGKIHSYIKIFMKPPESWSFLEIFKALNHIKPCIDFPDLDNIEKTAWDTFSDASLIKNDKAITKTVTTKEYSTINKTIIKLVYIPINNEINKERLSKEEINEIKKIYNKT